MTDEVGEKILTEARNLSIIVYEVRGEMKELTEKILAETQDLSTVVYQVRDEMKKVNEKIIAEARKIKTFVCVIVILVVFTILFK